MTASTPQEEIDKQHEATVRLLQEGLLPVCCGCNDNDNDDSCGQHYHHRGEIPLTYKTCPTDCLFSHLQQQQQQQEEEQDNKSSFPLWSSRADNVDISALQDLVREGHNTIHELAENNNNTTTTSTTNLWDPANAAVNNVRICRPSHDAWGIGKIVLIYSDDFLQQRFHMPWWHLRADIRRAVHPILQALQLQEQDQQDHRIARMLLASLPPGVTIPIHNDSGEWVKYTHRVHVPILVPDPNQIVFQVGLCIADNNSNANNRQQQMLQQMQRIDCRPGHVFEINNQAKHTVSNCSRTDYRVHLILDYVDADFVWNNNNNNKDIIIKKLQPGQMLLQTRRSVDLLSDRGKRPTPSFMILGAQKAGTTSLYEYIMQHPLVVRPKRRETHCLDWRWKNNDHQLLTTTCPAAQQQKQWCLQFYSAKELAYHPSCLTGDSTPSYLIDSRRVIPRLQTVFADHCHDRDKMQFFVVCREPIQRAESHYAMVTSSHGTAAQLKTRGSEWRQKTLQQVVYEELRILKECGLLPHWNIETGVCDDAVFADFAGSPQEDQAWQRYLEQHVPLHTGSYGLLTRGLYELQLRPWLKAFDTSQFLVLLLEDFQEDSGSDSSKGGGGTSGGTGVVTNTMQKVWKHLGLPPIDNMADETPKNQREYQNQMDEELKQYLQIFFAPYNRRLQVLLEQHGWANDAIKNWMYD